jgi:hypothetical protein
MRDEIVGERRIVRGWTYRMIRTFDGVVGGVAAGCVTVSVRPPAITVPVRAAPVVLLAVVTLIVPVPVLAPVTAIHADAVVAVHWHPAEVVMPTLIVLPAGGAVTLSVDSE